MIDGYLIKFCSFIYSNIFLFYFALFCFVSFSLSSPLKLDIPKISLVTNHGLLGIGMNRVAAFQRFQRFHGFHRFHRLHKSINRSIHTSNARHGFLREFFGLDSAETGDRPTEKNRFGMMEDSPIPEIRKRAEFIKSHALCPVTNKPIRFTCPKSGVPTHHDEAAWKSDKKYWEEQKWRQLKESNMYDVDLRSGRDFPELDFPGPTMDDQMVNLLNWDTYFYTRNYTSMDSEFQLAVATKMLTYPLTMAAVLDQYSPYNLKPRGPLTLEGLKSAAALRYTLFPEKKNGPSWQADRPMRFFIVGARMESQLPWHAWCQLAFLFPKTKIELVFIGPEAYWDRKEKVYKRIENNISERVNENLILTYYTSYFHTLHNSGDFMPYDPYLDAFFLFHPGLGSPESKADWLKSVPGFLESKCPIYVTGFHRDDMLQDWNWVHDNFKEEMDILIEPTENAFKSTKWEFNDSNPQEIYQLNQQLFAFRGKRHHITT